MPMIAFRETFVFFPLFASRPLFASKTFVSGKLKCTESDCDPCLFFRQFLKICYPDLHAVLKEDGGRFNRREFECRVVT